MHRYYYYEVSWAVGYHLWIYCLDMENEELPHGWTIMSLV
jgi:hypothetical protein